jgi:hypothetical protein
MQNAGIILFLAMLPSAAMAGLSPLEAISMIESGNNDAAVGRAGEVSRYQIRPHVWKQFSAPAERHPAAYGDPATASAVAQRYVDWLGKYYKEATGRAADNFDLYVMWNAGAAYYRRIGFTKDRVHPTVRARADRFVNLREMRNVTTAAVQPQAPTIASAAVESTVVTAGD